MLNHVNTHTHTPSFNSQYCTTTGVAGITMVMQKQMMNVELAQTGTLKMFKVPARPPEY